MCFQHVILLSVHKYRDGTVDVQDFSQNGHPFPFTGCCVIIFKLMYALILFSVAVLCFLQDDGDVEDDMTMREVRYVPTQSIDVQYTHHFHQI